MTPVNSMREALRACRPLVTLTGLLALLGSTRAGGLGGPVCPEVRVGDDRSAQRDYGGVLILPNGAIVAGYTEEYHLGWEYEAYIQLISPTGDLLGERTVVHPDRPHRWSWGSVGTLLAPDSEGGFAGVWQTHDGRSSSVFLQRFTSDGEQSGERVRLLGDFCQDTDVPAEGVPCGNMSIGRFEFYVREDGHFVIVYNADCALPPEPGGTRSSCWFDGIWIQMYDFDTHVVVNQTTIPGYFRFFDNGSRVIIGDSKTLLSIAPLPDGGVIILWREYRPKENENRLGVTTDLLFAQRLSGELSSLGEHIVIETEHYGGGRIGDVAADPDGNFAITWYDYGYEDRFGDGQLWPARSYLYLQRFNASGERQGERILVYEGGLVEYRPEVVMDAAGTVLVTFRSGSYRGVRYDREGNRLGPPFQISLGVLSPYAGPCLADLDDSGKMVFLYPQMWIGEGEPYAPSAYLTNIFLRIVEPDAPAFLRGDANGDGRVTIFDAIATLGYLFSHGTLSCLDAADANDDERLNLSDAISVLGFLFTGEPRALPHPWPYPGFDPTP